jgi:hypothetical protein
MLVTNSVAQNNQPDDQTFGTGLKRLETALLYNSLCNFGDTALFALLLIGV